MEKTMILDAKELGIEIYTIDEDYGLDMNSERAKKVQEEAINAWQQVYVTDFSNKAEVVGLLINLQPFTENRYAQLPIGQLLTILKGNGYKADDCSGNAFDGENQDNFARFLIGQAIATLENSYWNLIVPTFVAHAKDFQAKFNIQ